MSVIPEVKLSFELSNMLSKLFDRVARRFRTEIAPLKKRRKIRNHDTLYRMDSEVVGEYPGYSSCKKAALQP